MKIVCEACGAKYSIADEKVAGKTFKIRCKKCSEVIVVRGNEQGLGPDSSSAIVDPTATMRPDAVWHVVVNGEQQGPFAPSQIGDMLAEGTIDWEAYVWREGFDNWLAARDVEDLVQAVMSPGESAESDASDFASEPAAAEPAFAEPAFAMPAQEPALAEPAFAAPVFSTPAPEPEPVFSKPAASRAAREESVDLFGQEQQSASLFGSSNKSEEAAAAVPAASASAPMTGSRNENSVLFSLSSLQASASGNLEQSSPKPVAGAGKPAVANTEGSGLIDIRALSNIAGPAAKAPGAAPGTKEKKVDDLLSLGTGGSAIAYTAPVLAPVKQEESSKTPMIIGVAAVLLLAVGAGAFFAMKKDPEPTTQTIVAAAPEPAAPAPAPTPAPTPVPEPTPAVAPVAAEAAPAAAEPSKAEERRRPATTHAATDTPTRTEAREEAAPVARTSAPARTNATPARAGSLDELLARAAPATTTSRSTSAAQEAATPAPNENLPEAPTADQVRSALSAIQPAIASCSDGQHGLAQTAIEIAGATGRVRTANVTGQFASTPIGSCVARAVRGAHFPRFRREVFTVNYPFRL